MQWQRKLIIDTFGNTPAVSRVQWSKDTPYTPYTWYFPAAVQVNGEMRTLGVNIALVEPRFWVGQRLINTGVTHHFDQHQTLLAETLPAGTTFDETVQLVRAFIETLQS